MTVPHNIPYTCQFASPEMVRAFVHGEREIETDPRWAEYGANDPAEYAHWARRSCGVVCVKMAVEGLCGQTGKTVMDWVREGLAINGYLTELRHDRPERPLEKGWKHASLAQLARSAGCCAEIVSGLTLDVLARYIQAGRVLIASVSSELGEEGPVTRQSGHLVLIYGIGLNEAGHIQEIILHNPSGRSERLQAGARIPATRFMEGFSGRGIVMGGC